MTQNLLFALTKLLIKPKAHRQLMRMQYKSKVIETNMVENSGDSSEDEQNLAIEHEQEILFKEKALSMLDDIEFGDTETS